MDEETRQAIINIQNQIETLERKITEGVFSNTLITTKEQIVQRGGIQSNNYVADTSGWRLDSNGNINGNTSLAGTKIYYVSDSSGGAVTRKLTFKNGILISET